MAEQVTFGIEVARALMGAGVPIRDRHNVRRRKPADRANFPPYHLPAGATLTSEQVTAAVQADPGRLAARRGFDTYVWQGCRWLFWSPVAGCLSPGAWASPAHNNGRWELVYRLDIERTPERPPRPAQGTTLRAIMEWCAWAEKGAACRRMSWCFEIGDCHINCDGDLEADEIWLSAEDAHEATDWRASTDDGKTWFVPGQVEQLQESGPKETVSPDFMHEADARTLRSCPDDIRAAGWAVAVHNDYRQNSEPHTFWLFTRAGRAVVGEGQSDAEALDAIRCQIRVERVEPPEDMATPDPSADVQLPRTTHVMSEAVAHAEAGGVTQCEGEFFRVSDGVWECRSSFGDSWDAGEGQWLLTTGCEYTLYPADHLDDAPRRKTNVLR